MGHPTPSAPFPESVAPEADLAAFDDEYPSESGRHAVSPTVSLAVADPELRDSLSVLLQHAGYMPGDDELLAIAAVVITDAAGPVAQSVAAVRARARSDATIIAVLPESALTSETSAAYGAGALLCLRMPLDEHQLLASVGSAIDLRSARVRADDLVRQLDVQAHLAAIGRVTAGFTHEVSNPLAVLAANFEAVRDDVEWLLQARDLLARPTAESTKVAHERMSRVSPADVRAALKDMATALHRVQVVLDQARDLAQARPGSRIEDVELASVVRDVRGWAGDELRGIDVLEVIDEPIVARADPRLLGQIVLNLVTNAAHAARQLPSPRIRLHVYASAHSAILSVRDNGPGVPAAVRDRIFEPFFTTRRGNGGTGLGLALCREYAAQMQAQLTLWTAPGRGACFRVHMRRMR